MICAISLYKVFQKITKKYQNKWKKKHSEVLNKQKLIQKYRTNVTMNICQYIIFLFPMVSKLRILEHFKNKCKKNPKLIQNILANNYVIQNFQKENV